MEQHEVGLKEHVFIQKKRTFFPYLTCTLIFLIGFLWILSQIISITSTGKSMFHFFITGSPLSVTLLLGAVDRVLLSHGNYWRLVSANFIHREFSHFLVNMVLLFILGMVVEKHYGRFAFLILYLFSGIAGCIASCWINPEAITYGTSAALSGLMGAIIVFYVFYRNKRLGGFPLYIILAVGTILFLGFGLFAHALEGSIFLVALFFHHTDYVSQFGGLFSGGIIGFFLTPYYRHNKIQRIAPLGVVFLCSFFLELFLALFILR